MDAGAVVSPDGRPCYFLPTEITSMKHWYTMVEIPDADTRAQKGDTLNTSEKIIVAEILITVCAVTFIVASCFAGTIQRHVFEAGVAFDEAGKVVVSTETGRGER